MMTSLSLSASLSDDALIEQVSQLATRHVERRGGSPMTLAEQRHFRSMVQRIATVLAMTANLDAAYTRASGAAFTAEGLGVR